MAIPDRFLVAMTLEAAGKLAFIQVQHKCTLTKTTRASEPQLGFGMPSALLALNDTRRWIRKSIASSSTLGPQRNVEQLVSCESKQTVAAVWRPKPVTGYCRFTLTRERAAARRFPPSVQVHYRRMTPCETIGLTPQTENPVGYSQSQPGSFFCLGQGEALNPPTAPGSAGGQSVFAQKTPGRAGGCSAYTFRQVTPTSSAATANRRSAARVA
jgi:hypothetical protein